MTAITQSNVELRALCELNGLMVIKYCSIYGPAYEVLTANGKERICHGENQREVLEQTVKYLEARAVLTGKPMKRGTSSSTTKNAAAEVWARQQQNEREIRELEMHMKQQYFEQMEALRKEVWEKELVRNQLQLAPLYPVIRGGSGLLGEGPGATGRTQGAESKKKV